MKVILLERYIMSSGCWTSWRRKVNIMKMIKLSCHPLY
jgi:thymidylate kinase